MALIFKGNSGISADGKDINGKTIPTIASLNRKKLDSLYLYCCNSAHTDLLKERGTNVAEAFSRNNDIGAVYGFDGSVSFGNGIGRLITGKYEARLSNDQSGFTAIYSKRQLKAIPPATPRGLCVYLGLK